MKIKLIFIETGVQKQHIMQFWTCDELKIGILELGNEVKVTEELREIYGWLRMGYRRIIPDYTLIIWENMEFGLDYVNV